MFVALCSASFEEARASFMQQIAERAATHADLEATNDAMDEISNAVADDIQRLEATDGELSDRLKALSDAQVQELQAVRFAMDEALVEHSAKMEQTVRETISAHQIACVSILLLSL